MGKAISVKHLKDKSDSECRDLMVQYYKRSRKAERDRDMQKEQKEYLLAALESCVSWMEWMYHPEHDQEDIHMMHIRAARMAIEGAKA